MFVVFISTNVTALNIEYNGILLNSQISHPQTALEPVKFDRTCSDSKSNEVFVVRCFAAFCVFGKRVFYPFVIMADLRTCTLHPLDSSYESILIPHKKSVILGRNPFTKVTDKRCSRSQVEVEADVEKMVVKVTHIGANKAGVNGLALEKKSSIVLKHNDTIELVLGYFIYRIEFDPLPCDRNERKRLLDVAEEQATKRLCNGNDRENKTDVAGTSSSFNEPPAKSRGWETIDGGKLLIYTSANCESKSKIAAFDLDGTLISTKSGKVFPVNNDDWKIAFPIISGKLKNIWENGHKIVIMTNQAGIGRGKVNVKDFKKKIEAVVEKLGVPAQVFVSTGKGIYRKPAPGMWNTLLNERNENITVNMQDSFYCGDAAGRPEKWAPKRKKDFSSADRLLALNLRLKFLTPEEFFLKERPAPFNLPEFIPSNLKDDLPLTDPDDACISSDTCEVIVLVGSPGSGKSHFAKTYLVKKGYFHVNRDSLGSWQKCISELEKGLSQDKSVVVDNTSPDKESRKRFVAVAQKFNVPCRCFVLNTGLQHAKHNNRFRELTDDTHQEITDMVINSYIKKYEEPKINEGFSEIVKVNCVPKFDNSDHEQLYKMFLLEK